MMAKKSASNSSDGVGSSGENISEDWTRFGKKQILSIGKKRQRLHEDDEEHIEAAVSDNSSSDDEEEGRTSAVREKKRNTVLRPTHQPAAPSAIPNANVSNDASTDVAVGDSTSSKKKKKKKKGKKERAIESNTGADSSKDITKSVDAPKEEAETKEAKIIADALSGSKDTATSINQDGENNNNKRKRKKVRSRQKNIRKDNRAANNKPTHLVPGRSDYIGRPLTKETRKRLGLESNTNTTKKSKDGDKVEKAFDSGEWVGGDDDNVSAVTAKEGSGDVTGATNVSEPPKAEVKETGDTLTKIGDCIVSNDTPPGDGDIDANKLDVGESLSNGKDKKKKKQKKRKFKNLVVG